MDDLDEDAESLNGLSREGQRIDQQDACFSACMGFVWRTLEVSLLIFVGNVQNIRVMGGFMNRPM